MPARAAAGCRSASHRPRRAPGADGRRTVHAHSPGRRRARGTRRRGDPSRGTGRCDRLGGRRRSRWPRRAAAGRAHLRRAGGRRHVRTAPRRSSRHIRPACRRRGPRGRGSPRDGRTGPPGRRFRRVARRPLRGRARRRRAVPPPRGAAADAAGRRRRRHRPRPGRRARRAGGGRRLCTAAHHRGLPLRRGLLGSPALGSRARRPPLARGGGIRPRAARARRDAVEHRRARLVERGERGDDLRVRLTPRHARGDHRHRERAVHRTPRAQPRRA